MQQRDVNEWLNQLARQFEQPVGNNYLDVMSSNQQSNIREKWMFKWNIEQLQAATDGDLVGPLADAVYFDSISTDTRTLKPGALYIAIKGQNFDGHDFVEQAVKQGAAAVLVSSDVDTIVPGVMVEDTRIALGQFAKWHRQQMPVKKLIAVTGSNGKTSVKTLLQGIFSLAGETLATEGNLNNDFGVPRTLLNLRPEHEYAVIEMGANHPKEISYLTALACPDIAIINNAGAAHLEGFGSLQGIIDTKGEIFQGLNQIGDEQAGFAILNTDSPGYQDWQEMLVELDIKHKIEFGAKPYADMQLVGVKTSSSSDEAITFDLIENGVTHSMIMPMLGYHNAMNAAACAAIARAAQLDWSYITQGISEFTGVAGRLQKNRIQNGWLIDDSYNANPESVKAGIDVLCSLEGDAIVCLGAMGEVGDTSKVVHDDIAEYAKNKGVKHLFVYGEDAQFMPQTFGQGAAYFVNHSDMVDEVTKKIQTESKTLVNILVKGSRSAKMEEVAKPLIEKFKTQ